MLQTMAYALSRVVPTAVATGLISGLCSVYLQSNTLGASGASTGAFDVAVVTAVPCMAAPERESSISSGQRRDQAYVESEGYRHVWLAGAYYDQIFPLLEQGMQAHVTDAAGVVTVYNLRGCEPDSQNQTTRLKLEVISV